MKAILLDHLQCPQCDGALAHDPAGPQFTCTECERAFQEEKGIPLFTKPPEGLVPSEKLERGPNIGTPWRQANWRFLKAQLDRLPGEAVILDVGAGRGDFAALFAGRPALALDVVPYPEVDLVCDLTETNPLRRSSFDAICLMNVLEHVYDTHALLDALCAALAPGGVLLVAVPFMVKIHQAPIDYVRYTQFALERLGKEHGLAVEQLEGYYDPVFFLGEGLGNLRHAALPGVKGGKRYAARLLLAGLEIFSRGLGRVLGPGQARPAAGSRSFAPTGYQVVYRKR